MCSHVSLVPKFRFGFGYERDTYELSCQKMETFWKAREDTYLQIKSSGKQLKCR